MDKLLSACKNNYIEAIQGILEQGGIIDINHTTQGGNTALLWAAYHNNTEIVKLLLTYDANINYVNAGGDTTLIWAAYYNNLEMVKLLLTYGANINHANQGGNTVLIYATSYNNPEMVKLVLRNGANINHVSNDGETALKVATKQKYKNIKNIITLYIVLHDQLLSITYLQVIPRDIIFVIESFL